MTDEKRGRGRPPGPTGNAKLRRATYLLPDHWVKLESIGGIAWLETMLDKHTPTKLLAMLGTPKESEG